VTTQTVAGTKTAGDSPDGMWLNPQLRKAAGTLAVTPKTSPKDLTGGQQL